MNPDDDDDDADINHKNVRHYPNKQMLLQA